jgi:ABC-type transporter MlaC component
MPFAISRAVFLAILLALVGTTAEVAHGGQGSARAAVGIDVADAHKANEAELFVQASIDRGYRILNNKELSANDRQAQFREFLNSITDTKRVALFTLGTYARSASQSDTDRFMAAYDDFAAAMYQGYFDWYTGQSLRVANSVVRSPDDVVVYADVTGPNGTPQFKVGFRVRKDAAQRTIVTDFQFEGVWLALNQRADFTAYLQQNGGNFTALSSELQKRTQRFKEAWARPGQR